MDESGDWGYPSFDRKSPILCLCGFILDEEVCQTVAEPALAEIKRKTFGSANVFLHRAKVANLIGPFATLKGCPHGFEKEMADFLQNLDYRLVITSVDKKDQYQMYGERPIDRFLPQDIYLLLFTFLVERFLAFLIENTAKGRIVAEKRGGAEDARVLREYAEMYLLVPNSILPSNFVVRSNPGLSSGPRTVTWLVCNLPTGWRMDLGVY